MVKEKEFNLSDSRWYLNRELTWLEFNKRVLAEGSDLRNPLLERVFFFAVVGGNLDEFFMKRIGGLKQLIGAGVVTESVDGMLPREQIEACSKYMLKLMADHRALALTLNEELAKEGILITPYADLKAVDRKWVDNYFQEQIFPLLTPQGIDPAHPFPFISNLSINLLVSVRYPGNKRSYKNRIKIPVGEGIPRFIQVGDKDLYVVVEDLVSNNLVYLLPGMEIESTEVFRVTRNAITERNHEQANDLLHMMQSALRDREFAEIVRLEVSKGMQPMHKRMLAEELGIDEKKDVYEVVGLVGKVHMMEIARIERPDLHFPPYQPVDNADLIDETHNIFQIIRKKKNILLTHPYESFDSSVERFLKEASSDPKVMAIKMTIYRTASESRIIEYLLEAARNGKQVAVVVELMARFDEQANMRWASRLEQAGIHVTYGVIGLKTHSKTIFVVRRDYDGLRRYAHIGTGNYHAGTARGYCDLGLLSCDPSLMKDMTEFFNYLTTGYTPIRRYKKLIPSPKLLKKALLSKIYREIEVHKEHGAGLIQLKSNALEDRDITEALYRASQAGVKVDLIIRDTCRLRPGIPGLSENIRVVSLVGRFLEHSRIFYFRNNGKEEYYIGSADLMKRNLESRVEACVPVEGAKLRAELREILDLQLSNIRNAWEMKEDGSYCRLESCGKKKQDDLSIDQQLIESAQKRLAAVKRKQARNRTLKKKQIPS